MSVLAGSSPWAAGAGGTLGGGLWYPRTCGTTFIPMMVNASSQAPPATLCLPLPPGGWQGPLTPIPAVAWWSPDLKVLQGCKFISSSSVLLPLGEAEWVDVFETSFHPTCIFSTFYPVTLSTPCFSTCGTEITAIFIQRTLIFTTIFNVFPPMQCRGCLLATCREWAYATWQGSSCSLSHCHLLQWVGRNIVNGGGHLKSSAYWPLFQSRWFLFHFSVMKSFTSFKKKNWV